MFFGEKDLWSVSWTTTHIVWTLDKLLVAYTGRICTPLGLCSDTLTKSALRIGLSSFSLPSRLVFCAFLMLKMGYKSVHSRYFNDPPYDWWHSCCNAPPSKRWISSAVNPLVIEVPCTLSKVRFGSRSCITFKIYRIVVFVLSSVLVRSLMKMRISDASSKTRQYFAKKRC